MKTPAVTMVAAWISAEMGVGPSIASGSQTWSGTCADLPTAPMNSSRQIRVSVDTSHAPPIGPSRLIVSPLSSAAWAKTCSYSSEPKLNHTRRSPSRKPKSPIRFTTKALVAAARAESRSYQWAISRYEQRPTASQKTNNCKKLSAMTSISMEKVKRAI